MENQTSKTNVGDKRDYWNLAYKNFLFMSFFGFFIFILSLVINIVISVTKPEPFQIQQTLKLLSVFTMSIIWLIISQLFKRHNKNAILIGYIFLGFVTVFGLFLNFNPILLIILAYLFVLIYKASKVSLIIKA